jgi:opacity protein-like surface antigen
MKVAVVFTGFLLLMYSAITLAQDFEERPQHSHYAAFNAGGSFARDPDLKIPQPLPADLGHSLLLQGAFGLEYFEGLNLDFSISYRGGFQQISGFPQMPTGSADFHSWIGMVSGQLDVYPSHIRPFVSVGIGVSRNQLDTIQITQTDGSPLATISGANKTNFAWQVGGGIRLPLSGSSDVDMTFRYLHAGGYQSASEVRFVDGSTIDAKTTGEFSSVELLFGYRFRFK